jgi:tetratricopeptide (TPR) repeat protein
MYMGEPAGLEDKFIQNIRDWDRLAGPFNYHSIAAVADLALFYLHYDQPGLAIEHYRSRIERLKQLKTPDEQRALMARIDLLESETKYFLRPAQAILADALSIEKDVIASQAITKAIRDRYMQRLAMVRATFGDIAGLAKSVLDLPAPSLQDDQRPDRAITRWSATATLLAAQGKYGEACSALDTAANTWGERNRVLVAAPLYLRRALFCMLAGSPDVVKHLAVARSAIPDTIPATHRLRRVYEHLERSAYAKDRSEIVESQRRLAEALRIPQIGDVHPALLGLVF